MAGSDGWTAWWRIAVDDMQVGAANRAGPHFQQKLSRLGPRNSQISNSKGWRGAFKTIAITACPPQEKAGRSYH